MWDILTLRYVCGMAVWLRVQQVEERRNKPGAAAAPMPAYDPFAEDLGGGVAGAASAAITQAAAAVVDATAMQTAVEPRPKKKSRWG